MTRSGCKLKYVMNSRFPVGLSLGTLALLGAAAAACGPTKESEVPNPNTASSGEDGVAYGEGPPMPTGNGNGAGGPKVNEGTPKSHDVYDKENTDVVLARAGRQVKDNCGQAAGEDGKATGPWGKVTIQVLLGHNGHSKNVVVPEPNASTPSGRCITQAFSTLTFPPWNGQDTQVDWEVELVKPNGAEPAKPGKKK